MPKNHPQQVKEKALKMFLRGVTLEEISLELKVKFETVKSWHKLGRWKDKVQEVCRKTAEKLTELETTHNFNVIKEYVGLYNDVNRVQTEKPIEDLAKKRTKREVLKDIAQIAGYFKQEVKHSGEVTVIPIMGSAPLNIPKSE